MFFLFYVHSYVYSFRMEQNISLSSKSQKILGINLEFKIFYFFLCYSNKILFFHSVFHVCIDTFDLVFILQTLQSTFDSQNHFVFYNYRLISGTARNSKTRSGTECMYAFIFLWPAS